MKIPYVTDPTVQNEILADVIHCLIQENKILKAENSLLKQGLDPKIIQQVYEMEAVLGNTDP